MFTAKHENFKAKAGEPVKVVYSVTDAEGTPVTLTGATASYKIARRVGDSAILTKSAIVSGSTVTVEFNTNEIINGSAQLSGDFFDQLKVTKDGTGLYVCEGVFSVEAVIA